jgi:outer membrane translocation and assembly module TamA
LFPLSLTWTKNLGAAVFFDYGNIWETHKLFRISQIAMDAGFGVRYDLFLGPVRVDIGWKLFDPTDQHNEKWLFSNFSKVFKDKMVITFGIGQAF